MEDEVLSAIQASDDEAWLGTIERAARDRRRVLARERSVALAEQAWLRAKKFRVGQHLWVCASGVFLGGPLQRGDELVVTAIQPRARRLWATTPGGKPHAMWFGPHGVARFDLRDAPPESPISSDERRLAEAAGRALTAFEDE